MACSADEIVEHASKSLAKFKVPKFIKFTGNFAQFFISKTKPKILDSYPQTVTGKIKKFELRKQVLEDFPELKNEVKH